jgi:hypothetical protein
MTAEGFFYKTPQNVLLYSRLRACTSFIESVPHLPAYRFGSIPIVFLLTESAILLKYRNFCPNGKVSQ